MGNPVITQIAANANYSVNDSVRMHASLSLTMAFGEATFNVGYPVPVGPTPEPTITIHAPAGSLTLTVPAAAEQSGNVAPTYVVHWSTVDVAGTRTLSVRV